MPRREHGGWWAHPIVWWGGRSVPSAVITGFVIGVLVYLASEVVLGWYLTPADATGWAERLSGGAVFVLALAFIPARLATGYAVREAARRRHQPTPADSQSYQTYECSVLEDGKEHPRLLGRSGDHFMIIISTLLSTGRVAVGAGDFDVEEIEACTVQDNVLKLKLADKVVRVPGFTTIRDLQDLPSRISR